MATNEKPQVIATVNNIEVVQGTGKKSGNPYTALRMIIGDWRSPMVFPRSRFEWQHIADELGIDNPVN